MHVEQKLATPHTLDRWVCLQDWITRKELKNEINIESSIPNEGLIYFVKEFFCLQIDSNQEQTMVAIDE